MNAARSCHNLCDNDSILCILYNDGILLVNCSDRAGTTQKSQFSTLYEEMQGPWDRNSSLPQKNRGPSGLKKRTVLDPVLSAVSLAKEIEWCEEKS